MKKAAQRKPWFRVLYILVLIAVSIGIVIRSFFQEAGKTLKPFGDGIVKLVKMIIAPIIFYTVAHGIASMTDIKRLGRIGLKAIVYFELVSTLALIIGLVVVNLLQPGAGFNIDPKTLDSKIGTNYAEQAHSLNAVEFLLNVIPGSLFEGLVKGDILQVLLIAILSGFAISFMGERGKLISYCPPGPMHRLRQPDLHHQRERDPDS
jgi:aerobic C4-dicarboxylate transport protein